MGNLPGNKVNGYYCVENTEQFQRGDYNAAFAADTVLRYKLLAPGYKKCVRFSKKCAVSEVR